jgi:hypothetical protein
MRFWKWLSVLILVGCASDPTPRVRTAEETRYFSPVSMQLVNFSKVKDWSGSGKPEGVEALVEFDDSFGDRTKAAGTILFEIYDYRRGWPDPRGARVVNPFTASLQTFEEQRAHWDRATGAYIFRLAFDGARLDRSYVLTAMYESPQSEHRLFSQIVLPAIETGATQSGTSTNDTGFGLRSPEP